MEDHPAKRRRIEEPAEAAQATVAQTREAGLPTSRYVAAACAACSAGSTGSVGSASTDSVGSAVLRLLCGLGDSSSSRGLIWSSYLTGSPSVSVWIPLGPMAMDR